MLTSAQITALAAAIQAETDPLVVQYRTPATRDDARLAAWYNAASTTDAWGATVSVNTVDAAVDYSIYDSLQAGKRDSWALFLRAPTRDFSKNKVRKWVEDVWGASSANAIAALQAGVEKARRVEVALGGTSRTSSTVTALDRSYVGTVSVDEISKALGA